MKRTKSFTLLIILFGATLMLSGQETGYRYFPAQLSFFYPAGTHGMKSTEYVYNVSVNALAGSTGSIEGCELGGLVNINRGNMLGFQAAGIGNITNANVEGVQIGGLFSLAHDVKGLQLNGIVSMSGKTDGVQLSGIAGISASSNVKISGIANINTDRVDGVQLAGILNQTKTLHGFQLGLVNVVDTIEKGLSIGLVSIAGKGAFNEWAISFADYSNVAVSYKSGVKPFYNIYSLGMNFMEEQLWTAGFGFGHLKEVSTNFSLQPELVCYAYIPMDFRHVRSTYVTHLKIGFVNRISEKMSVSLAPSIYCSFKSDEGKYDRYGYNQSPFKPFYDFEPRNSNSKFGIGAGFSVGLNFH